MTKGWGVQSAELLAAKTILTILVFNSPKTITNNKHNHNHNNNISNILQHAASGSETAFEDLQQIQPRRPAQ